MPCLFAMFAGLFPRLGSLFIWLARPTWFMNAFNGRYIWPILGIIFLPFTTLMYVILWSPGVGLHGWDWFWIILAVLIDAGHYAQTAYQGRDYMPGYQAPPKPVA
jgi:hypothetical protein